MFAFAHAERALPQDAWLGAVMALSSLSKAEESAGPVAVEPRSDVGVGDSFPLLIPLGILLIGRLASVA